MDLPQTRRATSRLLRAAKHLIDNGFYLQGIARAYYAVYVAAMYLLRAKGRWPTRNGQPAAKVAHSEMPDRILELYATIPTEVTTVLSGTVAEQMTDSLYSQRIVADYYGCTESTEGTAKFLHVKAVEIWKDLIAEAERLAQASAPTPETLGTTPTVKGTSI